MALVRDPAFWRRFSVAVHLDEEKGVSPTMASPSAHSHGDIVSDDWLKRQQGKRARRACICWGFWLLFFAIIAAVAVLIWYISTHGLNIGHNHYGGTDSSSSSKSSSSGSGSDSGS
ncbi:MAG: hypothetical protein M1819_005510 [Sarea resinae]|nr:MAG: hypothetical protein M1819_005510 [Sarea resinae]